VGFSGITNQVNKIKYRWIHTRAALGDAKHTAVKLWGFNEVIMIAVVTIVTSLTSSSVKMGTINKCLLEFTQYNTYIISLACNDARIQLFDMHRRHFAEQISYIHTIVSEI